MYSIEQLHRCTWQGHNFSFCLREYMDVKTQVMTFSSMLIVIVQMVYCRRWHLSLYAAFTLQRCGFPHLPIVPTVGECILEQRNDPQSPYRDHVLSLLPEGGFVTAASNLK